MSFPALAIYKNHSQLNTFIGSTSFMQGELAEDLNISFRKPLIEFIRSDMDYDRVHLTRLVKIQFTGIGRNSE
jgi:hypothetical protein